MIGITEKNSYGIFSVSLGFLMDMRPEKLNQGYYNDEL
jgi:hypothetical protein